MSKTCTKCLIPKDEAEFTKDKYKKSGLTPQCTKCRYEIKTLNKEAVILSNAQQRAKNKEKIAVARNSEEGKKYHREYMKSRKSSDLVFKLAGVLRTRINHIVRGNIKSGSSVKDLGCTVEFLMEYLENKFQEGMAWENYGEWEIDHVAPLSKFDLSNREEFLIACNYKNLQPLWKIQNRIKFNKVVA